MGSIYGGDEVNALVADIGSHTVKAGYAGEDTPKAWFPSAVGVIASDGGPAPMEVEQKNEALKLSSRSTPGKRHLKGRDLFVGSQALSYRRDHMEVVQAVQGGLHADMDLVQVILEHAFRERLQVQDMAEHPVMLAEPTFNTYALREKLTEVMFEQFNVPALFLAKNAVLSAYATGRATGTVVDAGHESTVSELQAADGQTYRFTHDYCFTWPYIDQSRGM